MKLNTIKFIVFLTFLLCFTCGTTCWAHVPMEGDPPGCGLCHEGGGPHSSTTLYLDYQGNQGCINCHSSSTSSTTYNIEMGMHSITVPVVVYTGASAPTNYLSGGNFWWVKEGLGGDDTKGHNIFSGEDDDNYDNYAPGNAYGSGCGNNSCHDNLDGEWTGMFGTRQGCTSCHMITYGGFSGFHHADDTVTDVIGADIQEPTDPDFDGFFRFLSGKCSGVGHGVCGIEDDNWESPDTLSSSVHNEYLGYQSTGDSAGSLSNLGHTITGFCSGCHGNYHIRKCYGLEHQPEPCYGNWIRHGAGVQLCPDGLEGCDMAGYTTYDPQTPVARPDFTGWTGPSSTVNPITDLANCLSCHRAHGSPYPKMLRWDMTDTTKACATCHTSLKK